MMEPVEPFRCGRNIVSPLDDRVASIQLVWAAYGLGVSCQLYGHTPLTHPS